MLFFFFNDTATTEIYTLSLHDALPIYHVTVVLDDFYVDRLVAIAVTILEVKHAFGLLSYRSTTRKDYFVEVIAVVIEDRKSTRLNSSHANISYAVFCLKKKK